MKQSLKQQLSQHFKLYEFTRSGAAIEHDLDNTPNAQQKMALTALCVNILEPLRHRFGPIVISSGFRTQKVNHLVGGVPSSQHMRGEAADIVVGDKERAAAMFDFIRRHLDFDQLIWEPVGAADPRWLHVSYTTKRKNRRMVVGVRC